MPSLKLAALALVLFACGCKKKRVTPVECEAIVDRYAELVVKETMPDASASEVAAERAHAKSEARDGDVLPNCADEIQPADYDCAMKATTTDALEKCLE